MTEEINRDMEEGDDFAFSHDAKRFVHANAMIAVGYRGELLIGATSLADQTPIGGVALQGRGLLMSLRNAIDAALEAESEARAWPNRVAAPSTSIH